MHLAFELPNRFPDNQQKRDYFSKSLLKPNLSPNYDLARHLQIYLLSKETNHFFI